MAKILILNTENCCYSQMLHGFLAKALPGEYLLRSAGKDASGLEPPVILQMARRGLVVAGHTSNAYTEYLHQDFDFLVLCSSEVQAWVENWPSAKVLLAAAAHPEFDWCKQVEWASSQSELLLRQLTE